MPRPPNRRKPTAATSGTKGRDGAPRAREARVLDAAVKVFHERGYAAATVQDIADELQILKGSLYYYISSKEDLLYWLFEEVHEDVAEIVEYTRSLSDLPAIGRIEAWVRRQVRYNLDNIARVSVYHDDMEHLSPERYEIVSRRNREVFRFIVDLVREAQLAGESDPSLDARALTQCLFATVRAYRWYQPGGQISKDVVTETCVAFTRRGLQPERGVPA